ncbi:DUF4870 domain-containing protein [Frigoribacterium sp. PvP032]|uniref:DUF4870 domain-containing protein n=1 Tax=Frigoribacterium sp. PvP032 TaxID=2806589 RepID=UPI001B4D7B0C|nr:DUF4870 domain-containing protein [Frigoribacterium sp. PvP032]MBP1190623.1 putative Tic20 family protein [Frigoribacterium sp. PvP032]
MTDTPPSQPNDPQGPGWGQQQPGQGQPGYGQQPGQPGYGQQPGYGAPQPVQPMRPEDEKLWATLIHVGGILLSFVAPLVGYLVLKDRGPFVREHSRVALNFQLTMVIAYVIGGATSFLGIGVLITLAAAIVVIVFGIIAALAANRGEYYKYPLSIEFIKA